MSGFNAHITAVASAAATPSASKKIAMKAAMRCRPVRRYGHTFDSSLRICHFKTLYTSIMPPGGMIVGMLTIEEALNTAKR